ncbi:MAG TPA: hypothetical protein VK468_10120 [Pyrinomonadaceae bacterium]|nr:hypothetical protein [Pyrinomonadaceae bacterium]
MIKIQENSASSDRLRRFAEIYQVKMDAKPYMEIRARYESMTEAKLDIQEREFAENYVDTGKLDHLLHPELHLPAEPKPIR